MENQTEEKRNPFDPKCGQQEFQINSCNGDAKCYRDTYRKSLNLICNKPETCNGCPYNQNITINGKSN